jgi:hypothetical protein
MDWVLRSERDVGGRSSLFYFNAIATAAAAAALFVKGCKRQTDRQAT